MKSIKLIDLGVIDYEEAWKNQSNIFEGVKSGDMDDTLILCEHPHVYTLGKSGESSNILVTEEFLSTIGAKLYNVDRGGDITYHGFGQLVGYPILNIDNYSLTLKGYINLLEEAVIRSVAHFNIQSKRVDGATGVWCNNRGEDVKICAIGVKASRKVTMHGFALNVNTDLSYFNHINPCGFTEKGVASIKSLTGDDRDVELQQVKEFFIKEFSLLLGVEIKK